MKQFTLWLIPFGLLCLVWGLLTGWNSASWLIGLPSVLLGLVLFGRLWPRQRSAIQPWRLPGFAVWFVWHSLRGGLDVARRAVQPSMPLNPGFLRYSLSVEPGPPRVFLVNCLSLLPGTLSAELEGDDLILHALDIEADILEETRRAELWVKNLYGITNEDAVHG